MRDAPLPTTGHDDAAPRVVVVGSGAAGLTAALRAAAEGARVTVVTKSAATRTATDLAQGGIAAMTRDLPGGQSQDTPELHVHDTLAAGAECCDAEVVRGVVVDSPAAVAALTDAGVRFDRVAGPTSDWVQGLEGAHSVPRILHAGGDATGHAIQAALTARVREAASRGDITLWEYTVATDLRLRGGQITGLTVQPVDADGLLGEPRDLPANHVVLATGGVGQLYPFTTNPAVATGDGIALALRAGAEVRGMEFVQFHPTALAAPGSFLISEAVRGEGAVLRNHRGERFMLRVDPRAELAPRDVVARAIATERSTEPGAGVVLDCTGIPVPDGEDRAGFLSRRFPTIDAALREHGIEWSREPVPVSPAAHYLMGGIATDTSGRTNVPGLWAAGECAATGLHGANRLASNSLLEAVVFGERVGRLVAQGSSARSWPVGDASSEPHATEASAPRGHAAPGAQPAGTALSGRTTVPRDAGLRARPQSPAGPSRSADSQHADPGMNTRDTVPFSRAALQAAMWRGAGVVRAEAGLAHTQGLLDGWLVTSSSADVHEPVTLADYEDRNLLTVGREVARAARLRTQSCGAHHRADRAETHDATPEAAHASALEDRQERTAHAAPLSR
ncbi:MULTISPECIES: L-aspartate oxidase [Kocuria]|uniref:L-aspartate oxidase n=1 Tax=Kocuria TaxID=57493 RepID=UPI0006D79FFB|nr:MULTISPECIES: FAD-dependent oxidoreductase [Kocuria]MDN5630554.1 FAD-dependent oxidoreductase [Kocuria sp.]